MVTRGKQAQDSVIAAATHAVVEGSRRVPLTAARALGRTNSHATIEVTLKLRGKKELPQLNERPKQPMTREELAANYGASERDIDKVTEVFGKLGLKTINTNKATRTVEFPTKSGH